MEAAARDLAARKPEVLKVIQFGSLARGDAVPGSDADVLVLLRSSRRTFLNRISHYRLDGMSIGVDVFPYTQQELQRMQADSNPFVREERREGVVMYDRETNTQPDFAFWKSDGP